MATITVLKGSNLTHTVALDRIASGERMVNFRLQQAEYERGGRARMAFIRVVSEKGGHNHKPLSMASGSAVELALAGRLTLWIDADGAGNGSGNWRAVDTAASGFPADGIGYREGQPITIFDQRQHAVPTITLGSPVPTGPATTPAVNAAPAAPKAKVKAKVKAVTADAFGVRGKNGRLNLLPNDAAAAAALRAGDTVYRVSSAAPKGIAITGDAADELLSSFPAPAVANPEPDAAAAPEVIGD